jgi:translation initiation factor IF-3
MQTNNSNNGTQTQFRTRINQYIKVYQVRLVKEDGTSEILDTKVALKMAQEQGLDLVEINYKAAPPIVKIIDYGKYQYELKKKAQAEKKKQQVQELKELVFRPATDTNDLNHKLEQTKGFLEEGHRVKLAVKFRGREISHSEIGRQKLEWMLQQLDGLIIANPPIYLEGKIMSATVAPAKKQ